MRRRTHDELAASIVATAVRDHMGRGVGKDALMAAALAGVGHALERWQPSNGHRFQAWCSWWVRQALTRLVNQARQPALPATRVFRTDLDRDVHDRQRRLRQAVSLRRARAKAERCGFLDARYRSQAPSPFSLAFLELFLERQSAIERFVGARLKSEETDSNALLGDDEQRDFSEWRVHKLTLPDEDGARWELVVELSQGDLVAFFQFEGWSLLAVHWSD